MSPWSGTSYVAKDGLELIPSIHILSVKITGVHNLAWFMGCWGYARQVLYQLSNSPSSQCRLMDPPSFHISSLELELADSYHPT